MSDFNNLKLEVAEEIAVLTISTSHSTRSSLVAQSSTSTR